jgi:hypothetical protein
MGASTGEGANTAAVIGKDDPKPSRRRADRGRLHPLRSFVVPLVVSLIELSLRTLGSESIENFDWARAESEWPWITSPFGRGLRASTISGWSQGR